MGFLFGGGRNNKSDTDGEDGGDGEERPRQREAGSRRPTARERHDAWRAKRKAEDEAGIERKTVFGSLSKKTDGGRRPTLLSGLFG